MQKFDIIFSINVKPLKLLNLLVPSALLITLVGCGEDKNGEATATENCVIVDVGCGTTVSSSSNKISLGIDEAAVGDKYIVMPFSVGDIATVDGAGAAKFSFKVPVEAAETTAISLKMFSPLPSTGPTQPANVEVLTKNRDDAAHLIYGRYLRSRAVDKQAPGFWGLVDAYDYYNEEIQKEGGLNFYSEYTSLRSTYETQIASYGKTSHGLISQKNGASFLAVNQTTDCPTTSVVIPIDEDTDEIDIDASQVVSGTDYCIIYVDEPLVETDKMKIEAAVKKIMEIFKKNIYEDEFQPTNGFTFKPHFVIIDPSNEDYDMPPAYLGFIGVFESDISKTQGLPMLYLANDLTKIKGKKNDESGKREFYATLAHEVQHAISYYYRGTIAKPVIETVFLDEGIAHFMEDIFGYGAEAFPGYVGNYFATASFGLHPFLGGASYPESEYKGDNAEVFPFYRGAAQSFLYYLATQKGEFSFTDGYITGGGGLDFLIALTKSSDVGAKNLKTAFAHESWSWTETIGNYLIAGVLDNSSVKNIANKHRLPEVFKEVTDLQGTENKTFGMRFNDYGGILDRVTKAAGAYNPYVADGAGDKNLEVEVYHYQTVPGLHTVSDASVPYVIDTPDDTGTAAAVVRIK